MKGQALSWPRNNYHVDRVELVCTSVPNDIKYATFELANALANDTDSITGTTGDTGLYESVKLGEIEVKYNTSSQATGPSTMCSMFILGSSLTLGLIALAAVVAIKFVW